jgi:Ran GTPase-activating protein (RanGAP) involved in mRNA processing and transport
MNISEVPLLSVIVSLDLSFSQLNDDCCRPLAAALLSSGALHTLNLSGNVFKITGAKFLALGLEGNTSLHYLDLSGNHFHEGIDEISKALANHLHLEVLMLDGCRVSIYIILCLRYPPLPFFVLLC